MMRRAWWAAGLVGLFGVLAAGSGAVAAPGSSHDDHVDLLELTEELGAVLEWNPIGRWECWPPRTTRWRCG